MARNLSSQSHPTPFHLFTNRTTAEREAENSQYRRDAPWPEPPDWRRFLSPDQDAAAELNERENVYWSNVNSAQSQGVAAANLARAQRRGEVFRLPRTTKNDLTPAARDVLLAVNAAIHLRRPLLVTGPPGCGKTSLAYAIATELNLGPVLSWPVTPRSQLHDGGLFLYDAVGRLQEAPLPGESEAGKERHPTSDYLKLGPVGTAFLPFRRPRVLLIDELDKGDLQLPNELLHLFEEGAFEIPQLVREARRGPREQEILTADPGGEYRIEKGMVQCWEFPIVVLTSNGEREFPGAFYRRCLRVAMPQPTHTDLVHVVGAHFDGKIPKERLDEEIKKFLRPSDGDDDDDPLDGDDLLDRATDQLLNAWHLLGSGEVEPPSTEDLERLRTILYRRLHTAADD